MDKIIRQTHEPETLRDGVRRRARRTKVILNEERNEVSIETYLLGHRGADVFGGTATLTVEELLTIAADVAARMTSVVHAEQATPEMRQAGTFVEGAVMPLG